MTIGVLGLAARAHKGTSIVDENGMLEFRTELGVRKKEPAEEDFDAESKKEGP